MSLNIRTLTLYAGPGPIADVDIHLWPDKASRDEILSSSYDEKGNVGCQKLDGGTRRNEWSRHSSGNIAKNSVLGQWQWRSLEIKSRSW